MTEGIENQGAGPGERNPVAAQGVTQPQGEDPGEGQSKGRGARKERVGMVVSDKPDKTVTVSVESLVRHPRYKKRVRHSKRFMVHDEENTARTGDVVRIMETRPLSARKRWRLAEIVSRAE